jgi:hypothetical protein
MAADNTFHADGDQAQEDALSALAKGLLKEPFGAITALVEKGTATALLVVGLALSWLIGTRVVDSNLQGADFGLALGGAVMLVLAGAGYNAYTYKRHMDVYATQTASTQAEVAAAAQRRDARIAARELVDNDQMNRYWAVLTKETKPPAAP